MKIYCKKCQEALTIDCEIDSYENYNFLAGDTESPVEKGKIIILEQEEYSNVSGSNNLMYEGLISSKGAFSLNPEDVIKTNLISSGKDNGCCGSAGMDGFNRSCCCGNIIGTEWSDCWTQAEIRFEPSAVELRD